MKINQYSKIAAMEWKKIRTAKRKEERESIQREKERESRVNMGEKKKSGESVERKKRRV